MCNAMQACGKAVPSNSNGHGARLRGLHLCRPGAAIPWLLSHAAPQTSIQTSITGLQNDSPLRQQGDPSSWPHFAASRVAKCPPSAGGRLVSAEGLPWTEPAGAVHPPAGGTWALCCSNSQLVCITEVQQSALLTLTSWPEMTRPARSHESQAAPVPDSSRSPQGCSRA